MASRKIEDLEEVTRAKYFLFDEKMKTAGIDYIVTCTYRPQKEQNELYAQGRKTPGPIVTWTRNSKHTKRIAFDIAILRNGKITWEPEDYKEAGLLGESVGLRWGGRFLKIDRPHFELQK
jgi:peptidoglycan LD-endopeptidase CwlK